MSNSVIIRLQNLPLEARSIDIRKFFEGLVIPDGGVHIIGGEKGIAFIAFQSDEDARLAMARDSGTIFNSHVRLFLSSKAEMQSVIASARNAPSAASASAAAALPFSLPAGVPDLRSTNLDIFSSLASLISTAGKPPSLLAPETMGGGGGGGGGNGVDLFKSIMHGQDAGKAKDEVAQAPLSVDQILSLIQNRIPTDQKASTNETASAGSSMNDAKRGYNDDARRNDAYGGGYGRDDDRYEPKHGGGGGGKFNDYQDRQGRQFFGKNNQQFGANNKNGNFYDNGGGGGGGGGKASKRGFNQGGPYSGGDFDDSGSGGGKGGFSQRPKGRLDPIILVKNFSRNSGYKDIRTFLQGIQIEHDGIKLLTDSTGHRIGMALVKLMTIVDLKKALCRNGQFFEDSLIEVLQSSEEEFLNPPTNKFGPGGGGGGGKGSMKDGGGPGNYGGGGGGGGPSSYHDKRRMNDFYSRGDEGRGDDSDLSAYGFFLKIYGLPAKFEEAALKNIFNNVKFLQIFTTTPIAFKSNNPADGEPKTTFKAKKICQVETQLDLEKALTRQDERVGKSKLQIFQISKAEFDRELANAQKNPNFNSNEAGGGGGGDDNEDFGEQNDGGGGDRSNDNNGSAVDNRSRGSAASASAATSEDAAFLHMTGVPFSAHEMDVKTFFQGLDLAKITLLHDPQTCKPMGEVCCSFGSKQDRDKGLEKDNQLFRNRVVKIKPIELAEYQRYVTQEQDVKGRMKSKPFHNDDQGGGGGGGGFYKKGYNEFNNYGNNNQKFNKNGGGGGGGSFQNNNNNNFNNNPYNNKFRGSPNNGGPGNKSGYNNDFNRLKRRDTDAYGDDGRGGNGGGGGGKRIKDSNHEIAVVDLPPLPPELEQHRESLVLLNNVTHEATREDILDLFKIYSPIEQSLKIRHNEDGEPTGDVIIACKTPANANKACRFLNGYSFMGRPIKASLIAS